MLARFIDTMTCSSSGRERSFATMAMKSPTLGYLSLRKSTDPSVDPLSTTMTRLALATLPARSLARAAMVWTPSVLTVESQRAVAVVSAAGSDGVTTASSTWPAASTSSEATPLPASAAEAWIVTSPRTVPPPAGEPRTSVGATPSWPIVKTTGGEVRPAPS